jgi:hemolysin III
LKSIALETSAVTFEEMANSITHGLGALMSMAGLSLLVVTAVRHGSVSLVAGCSIFGVTLVLLYTASTLYHSFQKPALKHIFKMADHSCIYLLIAGTYTPFTLVTLSGTLGWTLLTIIWSLAVLGIVFKVYFLYRFRTISTIAYILMGWLAVVAIKQLISQLPTGGLVWLTAGGLSYTVGAVFYLWKRLPYHHAVWHVFVLGGSVCHYCAVLFYVVP